jgi:hypothetical protein
MRRAMAFEQLDDVDHALQADLEQVGAIWAAATEGLADLGFPANLGGLS